MMEEILTQRGLVSVQKIPYPFLTCLGYITVCHKALCTINSVKIRLAESECHLIPTSESAVNSRLQYIN